MAKIRMSTLEKYSIYIPNLSEWLLKIVNYILLYPSYKKLSYSPGIVSEHKETKEKTMLIKTCRKLSSLRANKKLYIK